MTNQKVKNMGVDTITITENKPLKNTYNHDETLTLCETFGYDIVSGVTQIPKATLWTKYHNLFTNNRKFDLTKEHRHLNINEGLVTDLVIDFTQPSLMSLFDANKHKRVNRLYCLGVYRNIKTNTIRGKVFRGLEDAHKVEVLLIEAMKEDSTIKVVECDARYHKAILRYGLIPKYCTKSNIKPYVTEIEQPIGIFQKVLHNNKDLVKSFPDLEALLNGIAKVVYEKNAKEFLRVIQQYHNTTKETQQKIEVTQPLMVVG